MLWACVLTWIFTGLVTIGLVASAVALAVSPDLMLDQVHRENPDLAAQGVSDDLLIVATLPDDRRPRRLVPRRRRPRRPGLPARRLGPDRADRLRGRLRRLLPVGAAVGAFVLVVPLLASIFTVAMLVRAGHPAWFSGRDTP